MGRRSDGWAIPFNGLLDDIRIYNRALSASEIQTVYSLGNGSTPASPDTTPPIVSITAPTPGSTVSGSSVIVSANASDNVGVTGVQFKLDSANLGSEDTTSPYSITWNTTSIANGSHTLTAIARDAAGNTTTSSGVTVSNTALDTQAPAIPTGLTVTAVSSSQINLSWNASTDNVGVTGYSIYRGGTQITTVTGTYYPNTGLTPSTTYSYTVAAYDVAGNVSTQSVSASATTQSGGSGSSFYDSISDNTWVIAGQGTYSGRDAGLEPPTSILAYSGMDVDTINNKLLFFGGGHNDYYGNEIWAWDINTRTWQRMYAPDMSQNIPISSCLPNVDNANRPGVWVPTQRPISRHTYDSVAFISSMGKLIAGGASTYSGSGEYLWNDVGNPGGCYPNSPLDTWLYDYATNQWTYRGSSYPGIPARRNGSPGGVTAYDSDNRQLVVYTSSGVLLYDPQADVWTSKTQSITPAAGGHQTMTYDSKRKVTYLFGSDYPPNNELWAYSVPNNTWTKIQPNGTLPPASGGWGIAYDSINDVVAIFGSDGLWIYDPNVNQWARDPGNPALKPRSWGVIFGEFKYDPIRNVFFHAEYHPSFITNVWAYRYKNASITPPPIDTTAPTVFVTAPTSGSTVSGSSLTMSANASDNVGVVGVQFKLDGVNLGVEDTTSPYSITWNTTTTSNGSHALTATARDAAGNTTTSSGITVTVNNINTPPPSTKFVIGDRAQVSSGPLNVRSMPSTSGTLLGTQATNALGTVVGGPTYADGFHWWNINYDNAPDGWSVEDFLVKYIVTPLPSTNANIVTIREKTGVTTTNYPVQIGRPFVQGEITNFPQALVNGTPVMTQTDVKTRWPDGSVKHAILSFLIPTLIANNSVVVTFQNQSTGNNMSYLSPTAMLSANFNFDAAIELTNGTSQIVSARTMLSDGSFTNWLQGPIATSIVLADHSTTRRYDIGFDSYRAFRPIFHATFWPSINKVKVRYIGEIANTETLKDQSYSLALRLGNIAPSTVYSKTFFTHIARTRWTKEFWIGGAPSAIDIDHNLAYLVQTKLLPNYDTSKIIPSTEISNSYASWTTAQKDLFDPGNWTKAMGTAGGRADIGPYPSWTVQWLYTGDNRLKEKSFGNADLAAAWPMHFREGNTSKYIDRARMVSGVGKVLSISTRPTITLSDLSYSYTNPIDRVVPVGTISDGGWLPDDAHQPDPHSPLYLLSGDYWYLEEMEFWASWSAAVSNGAATIYPEGRGPTGAEGGISGQIRGQAWVLRNRAQTAALAPDTSPEKNYFTTLINDAVAIWEGARNITNSPYYGNTNWNWGRTTGALYWDQGTPILHHWEPGHAAFVQDPLDPTIVKSGLSTWEQNFMMFALGRAKELGFDTGRLVSWLSTNIIGQVTGSGYDPYLSGAYRIPTIRLSDGKYFDSWANLKTGFKSTYDARTFFIQNLDETDHGYSLIALTAASMVASEPNGTSAWNWMAQNALTAPAINQNPKWAILPRTSGTIPFPLNLLGDLNQDGTVNGLDWTIMEGVWFTADATADLNKDGIVNSIDFSLLNRNWGRTQ